MFPLAEIPASSWAGLRTEPFSRELYSMRPGSSWNAPPPWSADMARSKRCLEMVRSESRRCSGMKYRSVLKDDMRWARSTISGGGAGLSVMEQWRRLRLRRPDQQVQ